MKIFVNPAPSEWPGLQTRACGHGSAGISACVADIVEQVRLHGDAALIDLGRSIDNVDLSDGLAVTEAEIAGAANSVGEDLKRAIGVAAENIGKFHRAQMPDVIDMETVTGVRCVQRPVAIRRVGLYIPGGSVPLFSTVLMLAIPAAIARCGEIIICTPTNKAGEVAPAVLYAAGLCGVRKIFKTGGAQAIAAMAFGTRSVPKVDKIFGPGNSYVTHAKQLLSVSEVAIDMPAGPSEVMVMADSTARAEFVAADLLSQAEHGGDSQAILVTDSRGFAEQVLKCVDVQLKQLPRADVARKALGNSRVIVLNTRAEMIAFANSYAAEHLIISMSDPWQIANRITAAGSIFIGNYAPESAGDYASGTNHTLPTNGWARAFSGVNVDSFMRRITYQEITPEGLRNLSETITLMAEAEGLDAHANAVRLRISEI